MKPLLMLVAVWLTTAFSLAAAEAPEDQYVRIYGLIQEADTLQEKGEASQAVVKYVEAQTSLKNLQIANPGWNEKIVKYRLQYIEGKLEPLLQKTAGLSP